MIKKASKSTSTAKTPKKKSSTRTSTTTSSKKSGVTQKNLSKNLEKLSSKSTSGPSSKKSTTRKRKKKEEISVTNSKKLDLFPHHPTFPYRLDDKKENKTCWFQCYEHVEKYINRYHMTSKEYKLWKYTD